MTIRLVFFTILICLLTTICPAQDISKINFDRSDTLSGYYLAIPPHSKNIKAVVVLLTSFMAPEQVLSETKLHNVAFINDMLVVVVPMKQKIYADSITVSRLAFILEDVVKRYSADTSRFVLAGYDEAGNIALRFTEHTVQYPSVYKVHPKVVFGIDTPVDLISLWHWSERQIKKNFWPGAVGDGRYYLDVMKKEIGPIDSNAARYNELTPFHRQMETGGNEKYLRAIAVRLYYDTDIEWQLKYRRNSYYDTKMPDASELVNRLLLMGNKNAAFISSKLPGVRSNGVRHPNSFSIVDEVECIQWIKRSLHIFDANTWQAPYHFDVPAGWSTEQFELPADFAKGMTFKGVEDLRFAPGWGDSTREDYWSYTYLWWLEGDYSIDEKSLTENLKAYYTGLTGRNFISRNIPADKQVPVVVNLKKTKTDSGDLQTFNGKISMLDYMTQKPVMLNVLIRVKDCSGPTSQAVFFEVSPKQYTHAVWKEFQKLATSFRCNR